MEQNFEIRSELADGTLATATRPTDVMGHNLFVTIIDDAVGFELMATNPWLVDTAMWSSDFPHSVSAWPNSRRIPTELGANFEADQLEKIAHGNAERVFGV